MSTGVEVQSKTAAWWAQVIEIANSGQFGIVIFAAGNDGAKKEGGQYTFQVSRRGLFILVIRTKDGVYTERIVVR